MDMPMSSSMSMASSTATSASSMSTGMPSGMSMMMDTMTPYLHFTGGENLLFKTWTPSSHGAIAGACIGLVALAIFERWVSAMRLLLVCHWRQRTLAYMQGALSADSPASTSDEKAADIEEVHASSLSDKALHSPFSFKRSLRTIEPFIWSHDIPRGALYAFQALLAYALMLAVMTFQAAFIISIILGLGIGEILFGRMAGGGDGHLLH
ncbi:uncharacterized protein FIBRA_04279 [Fibroporia radiculosa]|uniref:Copper transport protein n=1 Tax=Fibroporia radiculosa TaxID=599839 RepID=J4H2V8_9APHY|nr:uncharacterized protein FIBRA_04279 [Fibroporia radiculosa]CCM02199.1 predicted protein [Fibroporia radiculosa]